MDGTFLSPRRLKRTVPTSSSESDSSESLSSSKRTTRIQPTRRQYLEAPSDSSRLVQNGRFSNFYSQGQDDIEDEERPAARPVRRHPPNMTIKKENVDNGGGLPENSMGGSTSRPRSIQNTTTDMPLATLGQGVQVKREPMDSIPRFAFLYSKFS